MKAHRVAERRYARNRPVRSALRTFVKKARASIAGVASGVAEEAAALVAAATRELDQAASKGIIHKNQAARRKSRLMHQLAVAAKAATQPAEAAPPATGRAATRRRTAAAAPAAAPAAARATRARKPAAKTPAAEPEAPAPAPARARTRRTKPAS